MKGFNIPENAHVVNILPPVDITGGAVESDYFSVKLYSHVDIILTLGVTGATSTITVFESDDNTGNDENAIAFAVYKEETAGGDTLGVRTAVSSAGFATSTNDSITYVISIDAAELTDGFPYLVLKLSNPGVTTLTSAVAVLSGARYAKDGTPSAIT